MTRNKRPIRSVACLGEVMIELIADAGAELPVRVEQDTRVLDATAGEHEDRCRDPE